MFQRTFLLVVALGLISACSTLPARVQNALHNPEQPGTRWGILVIDERGNEIYSKRAEERFIPASNTKIVTSMAGYALAAELEASASPGTRLILKADPQGGAIPDLILVGGGDASLGDGPNCVETCLSELADALADQGITQVNRVIGDDTLFPDERWAPGWSQEDLQFYYGTAVSALSVNDNILYLDVEPGDEIGQRAKISWRDGDDLYEINNELITVAPSEDQEDMVRLERALASDQVRIYGEMAWNSAPRTVRVGVHNPARLAAVRFKRLIEERGVTVEMGVDVRHRPFQIWDLPQTEQVEPIANRSDEWRSVTDIVIAALPNSSLLETQKEISKNSNNLHSELLLRRLGLIDGTGSRAHGLAVLDSMLVEAGVPEGSITLSDGTGMSVYNRVTPAGLVRLLAWAKEQPWGDTWRADQPIAGVDGSLERRFCGTPLAGKLFAKTGTLNGVNALSGYMIADSGKELIFSIIANDRPPMTRSAIPEMQEALLAIAANH